MGADFETGIRTGVVGGTITTRAGVGVGVVATGVVPAGALETGVEKLPVPDPPPPDELDPPPPEVAVEGAVTVVITVAAEVELVAR